MKVQNKGSTWKILSKQYKIIALHTVLETFKEKSSHFPTKVKSQISMVMDGISRIDIIQQQMIDWSMSNWTLKIT
jgi:hypothetical protein